MLDFITVPVVVGICLYTFYKFVELLAHRKERILLINKIGEFPDLNPGNLNPEKLFRENNGGRFIALRFGAVLLGIGLGLLVAFLINYACFGAELYNLGNYNYRIGNIAGVIYGACTLIFGGVALLLCFLTEQKYRKENR